MCNKVIQHSAKNIGKTYKAICTKPEYKDGLCAHHYARREAKAKNYGQRDNYRPCTPDDLLKGRSMKLKSSNVHRIYIQRKGIIKVYSSKVNKYIDTDIRVDHNLFVCLSY